MNRLNRPLDPRALECLFAEPEEGPGATRRVLLVEDDAVDRTALHRHIAAESLPYTVVDAPDVAAARAALASDSFDAILLDHQLPDGTGFEVLASAADTPVVFLTGTNDLALAVKAVREGAADYLVKDTPRSYLQMLSHTLERAVSAHRMRRMLRRSRQLCLQALEEAPVAKVLTSSTGRVLKANRAACILFGRTEDEIVAGGLALLCPGIGQQLVERLPQMLGRGLPAPFKLEIDCRHRAGDVRQTMLYFSTVRDEAGEPVINVFQFQDLTGIRRIERQLSQARRLEALGTLAGGLAHEFNNLLTTIILNLQLVQSESSPAHLQHECTQAALNASDRARQLVARMLTFSRRAAGADAPVSLPQVVRAAATEVAPSLPPAITVSLQIDASCPPVAGDAGELQGALRQLGDNAAHAMRDRGGTLSFLVSHGGPPAELRARHPQIAPHHTVQVAVRDTGVGMTDAELERLFEPFHTTREPGHGTGLGLAGVYGTVQRHRGAMAVESSPGAGTTVWLCFPPAGAEGREAPAPLPSPDSGVAPGV